MRRSELTRATKETSISVTIAFDTPEPHREIATGLPFLDHMLYSCSHHGGFELIVNATGDLDVDPHHVVEDTGIVIGSCLEQILRDGGATARFGHAVIPMDEALSEATIDVCGRPTLVYRAQFPQQYAGSFPLWLFREFFNGLATGARFALHLECRYGENAHHMIEGLFKALGKAIAQAYRSVTDQSGIAGMSTKGAI